MKLRATALLIVLSGVFAATSARAEDWRIYRSKYSSWAYDRDSIQKDAQGIAKLRQAYWTAAPRDYDGTAYHYSAGNLKFDCARRKAQIGNTIYSDDNARFVKSRPGKDDAPWIILDVWAADSGPVTLFGVVCEGAAPPPDSEPGGTLATLFKRMKPDYVVDRSL